MDVSMIGAVLAVGRAGRGMLTPGKNCCVWDAMLTGLRPSCHFYLTPLWVSWWTEGWHWWGRCVLFGGLCVIHSVRYGLCVSYNTGDCLQGMCVGWSDRRNAEHMCCWREQMVPIYYSMDLNSPLLSAETGLLKDMNTQCSILICHMSV